MDYRRLKKALLNIELNQQSDSDLEHIERLLYYAQTACEVSPTHLVSNDEFMILDELLTKIRNRIGEEMGKQFDGGSK